MRLLGGAPTRSRQSSSRPRRRLENVGVDEPPAFLKVEHPKLIDSLRRSATPGYGHLRPIPIEPYCCSINRGRRTRRAWHWPSGRVRGCASAGSVPCDHLEVPRRTATLEELWGQHICCQRVPVLIRQVQVEGPENGENLSPGRIRWRGCFLSGREMDQSHQKDGSRKDRSVDGHMASLREIWPDAVALYTVVRPLNGPATCRPAHYLTFLRTERPSTACAC